MELRTLFQRIAAAIRDKDGTTATIQASAFPERIAAIPSGTDTSDATAAPGDVLSGKTAYARGEKVTGTMAGQGAQTITPGTADQTIPAGCCLTGPQTIQGDENLAAANIKQGVSLFGVEGSCIEWKQCKSLSGYTFTSLGEDYAGVYSQGFRIVENEDGTKEIACTILLILATQSGESQREADIHLKFA